MNKRVLLAVAGLIVLAFLPGLLSAQGVADPQTLASQNLRGYTHMFIAYFLCWAVIIGWVISIARRLGRLEKTLSS